MKHPPVGHGEIVLVDSSGPGRSPRAFIWRGRRYQVLDMQPARRSPPAGRQPSVAGRGGWSSYRSRLDLVRLRTSSGMRCILSCDVGRDLWRMERVLA